MEETITISKKKYDDLVKDSRELSALHAGGVDNWEWYGESMRNIWDDEDEG